MNIVQTPSTGTARPPPSRTAKTVVALAVVVALVLAQRLGIFHELSDPARAARELADLGPWGYVAFVTAYAVLQPFGLPGTVFVLVAPLIWPWPIAFALSMTGTMCASVVGFSFARLVARDSVSRLLPPKFTKYNDALAARAFVTVFVLRLVFWMPPLLHAFFGVSKVRFGTHFWASLAGYALPVFLMSYFGHRVFDSLKAVPTGAWIALVVGMALLALGVGFVRRRRLATKDFLP
jgi:uncharacterized membrane protein YdjX (TVP38/TMEM64 family)